VKEYTIAGRRKGVEEARKENMKDSAGEVSVLISPLKTKINLNYYFYWYSALGPVWAETRVQSGDWYGSGTLHPGQVLRGSLPLLSPAF